MSDVVEGTFKDILKEADKQRGSAFDTNPAIHSSRKEERREVILQGARVADVLSAFNNPDQLTLHEGLDKYTEVVQLLVHPDVGKITSTLYNELKDDFENLGMQNVALVLVGSGSFGGMLIREVAGTLHQNSEKAQDIDIQLICDNGMETSDETLEILQQKIDAVMKTPEAHNLPVGYKLDLLNKGFKDGEIVQSVARPQSNITTLTPPTIIASENPVDGLLKRLATPDHLFSLQATSQYFYPSIPAEINQRNRQLFMEGMQRLSVESPKEWRVVRNLLTNNLSKISPIKSKYFTFTSGANEHTPDRELPDNLQAISDQTTLVKGLVFSTLLDKTNNRLSLLKRMFNKRS